MKFKSISLLLLLIATLQGLAQDPSFTQFNSVPLFYNPAYAGSAGSPRLATSYRNEWNGLSQISYVSYDQTVSRLHGGIGLLAYNDYSKLTAGMRGLRDSYYSNTCYVGLAYAAKFKLSDKWSLSPAIKIGYRRLDITSPGGSLKTKQDFDLGFGVLLNTQKLHLGLSVDHINRPYKNTDRLYNFYRKYSLQFGYTFQRSSAFSFTPSLLCNVQGDFIKMKLNLAARYKWLAFGVSMDSGMSPMLGYCGKKLAVGCSYTWVNPDSKIEGYDYPAAYELSIRYKIISKADGKIKEEKPVKKHRVFRNRKRILQN